jgi:hypothetical protein
MQGESAHMMQDQSTNCSPVEIFRAGWIDACLSRVIMIA